MDPPVAATPRSSSRTNRPPAIHPPPQAVIFDEAHLLSNPDTKVATAARRLRTRLRFGLSGTVMPNDYRDIWGLMNLLVPNSLGDWSTFNVSADGWPFFPHSQRHVPFIILHTPHTSTRTNTPPHTHTHHPPPPYASHNTKHTHTPNTHAHQPTPPGVLRQAHQARLFQGVQRVLPLDGPRAQAGADGAAAGRLPAAARQDAGSNFLQRLFPYSKLHSPLPPTCTHNSATPPTHPPLLPTNTTHSRAHTTPDRQRGVVEQLPKKVDNIVFCELRPAQKRAYRRLVESPDVQVRTSGVKFWREVWCEVQCKGTFQQQGELLPT